MCFSKSSTCVSLLGSCIVYLLFFKVTFLLTATKIPLSSSTIGLPVRDINFSNGDESFSFYGEFFFPLLTTRLLLNLTMGSWCLLRQKQLTHCEQLCFSMIFLCVVQVVDVLVFCVLSRLSSFYALCLVFPISLDCQFLNDSSVFSNVYLELKMDENVKYHCYQFN